MENQNSKKNKTVLKKKNVSVKVPKLLPLCEISNRLNMKEKSKLIKNKSLVDKKEIPKNNSFSIPTRSEKVTAGEDDSKNIPENISADVGEITSPSRLRKRFLTSRKCNIKKETPPEDRSKICKSKREQKSKIKKNQSFADEREIAKNNNNCPIPTRSEKVPAGESDSKNTPKNISADVGEITYPPSQRKNVIDSKIGKSIDKKSPKDVPTIRKSIRKRKQNQSEIYDYNYWHGKKIRTL